MKLRGQPQGYAMVVLLVSLSIMAIMMTVALPVWRQMAQREKEAELVFRGEQYARAINLMQRKSVGALPPSIDFLVEQRFLRKKFKDPITNDDFAPVLLSVAATPGGTSGPQRGSPPGGAQTGRGVQAAARSLTAAVAGAVGASTPGAPTASGITGVTSKSKATSIRLYKGRNHYNEWLFVFTAPPPARGAGGPPGPPGQRGGRGPGTPQGPSPFGGVGGRQGNPNPPNAPRNPGGGPTGPGRGGPPILGPLGPPGR